MREEQTQRRFEIAPFGVAISSLKYSSRHARYFVYASPLDWLASESVDSSGRSQSLKTVPEQKLFLTVTAN